MGKNNIPFEMKEYLKGIADNLPQVPIVQITGAGIELPLSLKRVKGSTILEKDPKTIVEGEPVNPNKYYTQSQSDVKVVSHEKHMKRLAKAYKKGGPEAVNLYIKNCYKIAASVASTYSKPQAK